MNNKPFSLKRTCLAIGVAQALSMNTVSAATFTVNNGGDSGVGCTLREAVMSSSSEQNLGGCVGVGAFGVNDTINFSPSVTSVTGLASQMLITQDVAINPNGPPISINSLGNGRVFEILLSNVTMNNVTISGGRFIDDETNPNSRDGGGAIRAVNTTLTLTNSTISNNFSDDDGGGIFVASSSLLNLVDSTVSGNTAADNGGGIYAINNSVSVSIQNSTITGNTVLGTASNVTSTGHGGGIRLGIGSIGTITNSIIYGNSAQRDGGGIEVLNGALTLSGSTVSGNSSGYTGGGISSAAGIDGIVVTNSVVTDNTSDGHGGGIYTASDVSIIDSQITNNTARRNDSVSRTGRGGGVYASFSADMYISGSVVSGNSAAINYGGIKSHAYVDIRDSTVSNNSTDGQSGGIALVPIQIGVLSNVQILNNSAVGDAGGILIEPRGAFDMQVTISDSIISGNSSGETGGGIYSTGNATGDVVTINRTTISNNIAAQNGGGIYQTSGSVSLSNSTISNNISNSRGGGVSMKVNSLLSVNNSTVSENVADIGGGIDASVSNNLYITNSTITENTASSTAGNLVIVSAKASIISNSIISGGSAPSSAEIFFANNSGIPEINFEGVNILGHDAVTNAEAFNFNPPSKVILATSNGTTPKALGELLSPLADNGGPTQTHSLPTGSIAVDAANDAICAAAPVANLDQRGEPRPQGNACDIGAFESSETSNRNSQIFVIPLPNNKSVIFEL